jgi:hypothetical protein
MEEKLQKVLDLGIAKNRANEIVKKGPVSSVFFLHLALKTLFPILDALYDSLMAVVTAAGVTKCEKAKVRKPFFC